MRNSCTSRSLGQPQQKPWHKAPWLYAILLRCGMAALPQVKNLCTSMMNSYGITKKLKKIKKIFIKTMHLCSFPSDSFPRHQSIWRRILKSSWKTNLLTFTNTSSNNLQSFDTFLRIMASVPGISYPVQCGSKKNCRRTERMEG